MGGCLLVTLPLELLLGARVYRRFRMLVLAVLPVVVVFSVWDVVGIIREHWDYNPAYVTGIQLVFGMPLEELVFFVVIPICGLLTYEAVGQVLIRGRGLLGRGQLGGDRLGGNEPAGGQLEGSRFGPRRPGRRRGGLDAGHPESGDPESGDPQSGDPESGDPESGDAQSGDASAGEAEARSAGAGDA